MAAVLIVAALSLVLAACGAVINTTLVIEKDGSGARTITATLSASDLEQYVTGGTDSIVATINQTLPADMTFEGVADGLDGAKVFTFTITFSSPEDYEEKVVRILGAGGVVDVETSVDIVIADSVFRRGLDVSENFTSQDLLKWLINALVANGTVSNDNASNITEPGTTAVRVDGVDFETLERVSYSDIQDFGARGVVITTEGLPGDLFTRTVTYDISRETLAHDSDGYQAFFDAATPEGGEFVPASGSDTLWTIVFPAVSAEELDELTDAALLSSSSEFRVSSKADPQMPGSIITTVVDRIDCRAVCAEGATVEQAVVTPAGWTSNVPSAVTEDGTLAWTVSGTDEPMEFHHRVPFESITVTADIGHDSESSISFDFVLESEHVDAVGAEIEAALTPAASIGTLTKDSSDDATTYHVVLTGKTPQRLAGVLGEYVPSSNVSTHDLSAPALSRAFSADLYLQLPEQWVAASPADGVKYVVHVRGGVSIDDASDLPPGASIDGGTVTFTADAGAPVSLSIRASGIDLLPVILVAASVLIAIALVILIALRLRRRRRSVGRSPHNETGDVFVVPELHSNPGATSGYLSPPPPVPPRPSLPAPQSPPEDADAQNPSSTQ